MSLFVKPFYLSSIVVGLDVLAAKGEDQQLALTRALQTRLAVDQESSEYPRANTSNSDHDKSTSPEGCEIGYSKSNHFDSNSTHVPIIHVTSSHSCSKTSYKFSKSNADYANAELASELLHEKLPLDVAVSDLNNVEEAGPSGHSQNNCSSQQRLKAEVRKISSCGTSVNWILDVPSPSLADNKDLIEGSKSRLKYCNGGTAEVIQADTGALQGILKSYRAASCHFLCI